MNHIVMKTQPELLKELRRLDALPNTADDWRDLYESIDAYQRRRLARAIAASPMRDALIASIRDLAERSDP